MKIIEGILDSTKGYIASFERNTIDGWWEANVGLPKNWVFSENDEIGIEILSENELGKYVRIFPKNHNVAIDDLIVFVEVIIGTNKKIADKEKEFTDKMEEMRKTLEKQASEFYKELDELKDNSFKKISEGIAKNMKFDAASDEDKKPRKPRTPKLKPFSGTTS